MSDGDALLAAILAQPDEDVPRLAYADWLDETGAEPERARAELIRVQIELHRKPAGERDLALELREKRLLAAHGAAWLAPLQAEGGPLCGLAHGQFRRGFVEVVWMSAGWFVTCAETLFARVPARELRVTTTAIEELTALAACPYFPRLNALDLSDRGLGDAAVDAFTRQPASAALAVLRLRGCALTDASARRLASAGFDWPLRELDVTHNPIGAAGLAALRERFGAAAVSPSSA